MRVYVTVVWPDEVKFFDLAKEEERAEFQALTDLVVHPQPPRHHSAGELLDQFPRESESRLTAALSEKVVETCLERAAQVNKAGIAAEQITWLMDVGYTDDEILSFIRERLSMAEA